MESDTYPFLVVARIAEYLEPMDRGERYEDPLQKTLSEKGVGRVTGGGSQMNAEFKIVAADIELELADLDTSLALVQQELEGLGVPHGSELMFSVDGTAKSLAIGNLETVELYLDGVGLPEQVYADLDFEAFYGRIVDALKGEGAGDPRAVWSGQTETGIFIYGNDAAVIERILQSIFPTEPILENSRMVLRRREPNAALEERRMPKQPQ